MAVPATWIRNNMLFPCEQYERQLTEAELKVQRSLQKLSIPDWYLNKRSNPPKIVNVTPIECRTPSWKNPVAPRNTHTNSQSSNLSNTLPLEGQKTKSKTIKNEAAASKPSRQQKSPETRHKRSATKAPTVKEEIFDTTIPQVKLPTHISKTFPKMSPSRKIQNINLVFPPGPKIELSDDLEDIPVTQESKYKTFVLKKQVIDTDRKNDNDTSKNDGNLRKVSKKKRNDDIQAAGIASTPLTPNVKAAFKVRATSTPKFTPANLFSSTIIEEPQKRKKVPSQSILEKSFIFEGSSRASDFSGSYIEKSSSTPRRKLSQSLLEKTSIFENSLQTHQISCSFEETPIKVSKANYFLQKSLRSIDPIIFEKDDTALTVPKSSCMVRNIVKRIEVTKSLSRPMEKNKISTQIKNLNTMVQEKSDYDNKYAKFDNKQTAFLVRDKKVNTHTPSPCTRFLISKRKSTDLEKVVKCKQPPREKGVVRGIIETLTEKISKTSLPRQNQVSEISHRNIVKKLVNALEKGDLSMVENVAHSTSLPQEEDSSSESEAKSCTTSASHKDTDSSSDSDLRSPRYKSDDDQRFDYGTLEVQKILKSEPNSHQEEDSVYWIPVSRCKLPRTSSLLSMMSRLSTNPQSPCISPIRSESELENADWGATYKKTHGLSRKLFRIDETTVIDSGYSDRSDKSGVSSGSSLADSTWSEDTQNDSGSETRSAKVKRSSRRKSIIGQTFCVH